MALKTSTTLRDIKHGAQWFAQHPAEWTGYLASLTPAQRKYLLYAWEFWAREKQLPPEGDWRTWLIMAGRGFGKTRTGAETVRAWVESGRCGRLALVARTASDVRDVMVEGESGILKISPPWSRPLYNPSKRRLTWQSGAIATLYTGDEPDLLRGPQHDGAWCLVSDTNVLLADGSDKPIARVERGDQILTSYGIRSVEDVYLTRKNAEIWRITTGTGEIVRGTHNHRVFTERGWLRIDQLVKGDKLCHCRNIWSSVDANTRCTLLTDILVGAVTRQENFYTEQYTPKLTGQFQKDTLSIIRMVIQQTTHPITWRLFSSQNISVGIGLSCMSLERLVNALQQLCGKQDYYRYANVTGVDRNIIRKVLAVLGAQTARPCVIENVTRETTTSDVYDLKMLKQSLLEEGQFFANSILVHNCDELAAWRYPETWDMLQFGLRLGRDPRVIVTTTPRPTALMREVRDSPTTVITLGTTYENIGNLAPAFFGQIVKKYEGTRLGRQELMAELLEDNPNALWKRAWLDQSRWRSEHLPSMVRVVVAVDPATTDEEESSETGIVVVGRDKKGHGYVLDDLSLRGTPDEWGSTALRAYMKWDADRIVSETNQGGQMVEYVMRGVAKTANRSVSYKGVRASRGKYTRAEPVSAIYEQGLIHHVGVFASLEDQLCEWMPGEKSPDRMDALVWGFTELFVEGGSRTPVGI